MYRSLNPGCLGIQLPWHECLSLAQANGFEAMDINVERSIPASRYREEYARHGLRPGGNIIMPCFREGDDAFRSQLQELPSLAKHAHDVGIRTYYTWILPYSDTLTYRDNFEFHVERLSKVARILADFGGRLALEFIGPKTAREKHRYPFVRTVEQMVELSEAIGPNAGLLLDSWHWHSSLGTINDILALASDQVVYVHINDAPPGVAIEKLQDTVRCVPGETGVEDLRGFLSALQQIGYDGPVVAEPFCEELHGKPASEVVARVARGIDTVWPGR